MYRYSLEFWLWLTGSYHLPGAEEVMAEWDKYETEMDSETFEVGRGFTPVDCFSPFLLLSSSFPTPQSSDCLLAHEALADPSAGGCTSRIECS